MAFRAFLAGANLEAYREGFVQQGYETIEDLAHMDEAAVRACGVSKLGHVARALRAIEGLQYDGYEASRQRLGHTVPRWAPSPVRTSPLRTSDSTAADSTAADSTATDSTADVASPTSPTTRGNSSCCVCYDDAPTDSGVTCLTGDFTCSECLEQHARTQNPDPVRPDFALMRDHGRGDGSLFCPRHPTAFGFRTSEGVRGGCDAPAFSDRLLARHLSESTFKDYLAVKVKCAEQRVFEHANSQWQRQLHSIQQQLGDRKLKLDRSILAEQLKRQFPNAYMCPRCKHGPIDHMACAQLSTHHGQKMSGTKARVNNACPNCGWFSKKIENWPRWDGILPEEADAAGVAVEQRYYRVNARRRARSQIWRETRHDTERNRRQQRLASARSRRTRRGTNNRQRWHQQRTDDIQLERALRLSRLSMVTSATTANEDAELELAVQRSLETNVAMIAENFVDELGSLTTQPILAGEPDVSGGEPMRTNAKAQEGEKEGESRNLKSTEPIMPPPPVVAAGDSSCGHARARDQYRRARVAARVQSQRKSILRNRTSLSAGRRKLALARLAIRQREMESSTADCCSSVPMPTRTMTALTTFASSERMVNTLEAKVFKKPYNKHGSKQETSATFSEGYTELSSSSGYSSRNDDD